MSEDVSGRTGAGVGAMVMGLMGVIIGGDLKLEAIWFILGGLGWEGRRLSKAPRFRDIGCCCC